MNSPPCSTLQLDRAIYPQEEIARSPPGVNKGGTMPSTPTRLKALSSLRVSPSFNWVFNEVERNAHVIVTVMGGANTDEKQRGVLRNAFMNIERILSK